MRDLESFVAEMAESEIEVKRQQDEGKGEVRVMTVHGAKGLEAPVVILPDTATRAGDAGLARAARARHLLALRRRQVAFAIQPGPGGRLAAFGLQVRQDLQQLVDQVAAPESS